MVFSVKNLGPIQEANLSFGELTLICGKNNNGKTYLTYTLDTFLDTIKQNLELPVDDAVIDELLQGGEVKIDLLQYVDEYLDVVKRTVPKFTKTLPRFLAIHPDRTVGATIEIKLDKREVLANFEAARLVEGGMIRSEARIARDAKIVFERSYQSTEVTISLLNKAEKLPARAIIENAVSFFIVRMFDATPKTCIFPETFIITCERTGAALFRPELTFAREMSPHDDARNKLRRELLGRDNFMRYQYPVEQDLKFVINLRNVVLQKGFLSEYHPELIELFAQISGGTYKFDSDMNQVMFQPVNTDLLLSMAEASSTVRSLAELYFYLAHKATPGQMLILDEPELNLHPESQRRLARLLTMLVNVGIKVFITTHSDYIVRELNALSRIDALEEVPKRLILAKHRIDGRSLLSKDRMSMYVLKDGKLNSVNYDLETKSFGVESFDDTLIFRNVDHCWGCRFFRKCERFGRFIFLR